MFYTSEKKNDQKEKKEAGLVRKKMKQNMSFYA